MGYKCESICISLITEPTRPTVDSSYAYKNVYNISLLNIDRLINTAVIYISCKLCHSRPGQYIDGHSVPTFRATQAVIQCQHSGLHRRSFSANIPGYIGGHSVSTFWATQAVIQCQHSDLSLNIKQGHARFTIISLKS